jgi:hypothetical protein
MNVPNLGPGTSSALRPTAKPAVRRLLSRRTSVAAGLLLTLLALELAPVLSVGVSAKGKPGAAPPPAGAPAGAPLYILFPARDMVDIQNFGTTQASVSVNYGTGNAVAATFDPTGARTTTLVPDPNAVGGEILINHPANPGMQPACWSGVAPSVPPTVAWAPGTTVTVTPVAGAATTHLVQNIRATPAKPGVTAGTLVVHGFALDPNGNQFATALNQLEVRLISKKNPFDATGKREIRADQAGLKTGLLTYDAATGGAVTATFAGLDSHDIGLITSGQAQTRILWRDNPATPTENTIYEADQVFPGQQAPCFALPL